MNAANNGEFRYAIHCIVVSWILSLVIAALPLPFIGIGQYVLGSYPVVCGPMFWVHNNQTLFYVSFLFASLNSLLILMIVFYGCILRGLRSHSLVDRELRLVKQSLLLIFCYCAIWLPVSFGLVLQLVNHAHQSKMGDLFYAAVITVQPLINPAFFAYHNPRLRTQFRNVLCCGPTQREDALSMTALPMTSSPAFSVADELANRPDSVLDETFRE